ncbi:MAG: hypothetical protein KatS3mg115_1544 [Candidatus Poribacteria bacterium]|nr:MAG: hypothetical protein KatS3mg115_1544 [Candidatus Poribacteria bacterium]
MSQRITRREFFQRAGAGALGLTAASLSSRGENPRPSADRPPNIIFILADDLGYGDLGCYGQRLIKTPHLDRMAAEGMRFTQAYAASTVCAPSRCGLMTGLHMGHAWIRGNQRIPLRPEDLTVAELLKATGYATGIIGKWGLGEPGTTGVPNLQGFDYWFGYLNQRRAHSYYPEYVWENTERFAIPENAGGRRGVYIHDLFTDRALWFLEEHRDRPFFLYLAYTVPHANNELGRETGNGMEVPDYGPYADRDWPEPEKGFAAMVHRLDRDVGPSLGPPSRVGNRRTDDRLFLQRQRSSSGGGPRSGLLRQQRSASGDQARSL